MIEVWDYFMRRKGLLLAVLATFSISSMLSYRVFRVNIPEPEPTYISVNSWNTEEIEIPRTGENNPTESFIAVMTPNEVIAIAPPIQTDNTNNNEFEENIDNIENDDSAPYQIVEQPENIVTATSTIKPSHRKVDYNIFYNLFLTVMGLVIIALGGYLTYWHFRR